VLLARQHGLPADELGEVTPRPSDGGPPRLVIELHGAGATGAAEDRGSRVADALIVGLDELRHAWEGGLARALGWDVR
jgi:poly(3-hydroxybutyrate) depolymerase